MYQSTIAKEIKFEGIGLHTGVYTKVKIIPAESNMGIVFKYLHNKDNYEIKADIDQVVGTKRGTTLGLNNEKIYTVEHILSALYGMEIDNAIIKIDNIELPILDGSTYEYVKKIKEVGIKKLNDKKNYLIIKDKIEVNQGNSKLTILPYNGFKISYSLDYNNKSIGKQNFILESLDNYKNEISKSRTFCTFSEIKNLQNEGLAKGGNLNNAIIYADDNTTIDKIKKFNETSSIKIEEPNSINNSKNLNNKKLLYDNEAVRHKILDLIGDLSLVGKNIKGHIISNKGGHSLNIKLVKKIKSIYLKIENMKKITYNKKEIEEIIPHRDPFLLIDKIVDGELGKYVCAVKYVNEDEEYFKGHFPGNPILPGVLIIECMAQASCFLSLTTVVNPEKKLMLLSVIKSAKFIKKVVPGDELLLKVNLIKFKLRNALLKGVAYVNDEIVAEAEWMATVVDKNENS